MPPLPRHRGTAQRPGLAARRRQQEQHRGRVEQQRNHENKPSEDRLVVAAKQARQISYRTKVGLDGAALAVHNSLLDLQVGEGLRLDRNPRRVAALERRSVLSTPALLMKRFAFFVREILISPTNPSSRNRALSHLVVDVREVMRLAKKVSYGTQ
jgi:hypothetical protein